MMKGCISLKEVREPKIILAVLPLLILGIAAYLSITSWKVGMFVPMIFSIIATGILGKYLGYKWSELQEFMVQGMTRILPVVLILFLIGTIIGTWILSGIIPTIIYYGLDLINPSIFIPTAAIITAIMSLAIGSSFTSVATVGVALMAVGMGMGFSPGLVAGAVISGAFLGDKLSPLSDTTNMAPGMCDTDLFSHIRHMMWDTIPAFFIAIVMFWIIGFQYSSNLINNEGITELMQTLVQTFHINPILFTVPLLTIYLMYKRYPAIPSLLLLSVLGGLSAIFLQGSSLIQIVQSMTSGYSGESGLAALDRVINRGGISAMFSTVALVITATALGGILEGTKVFKVVIDALVSRIRRTGSLMLTTIISTFVVASASGSQALPISLVGQSFQKTYKERGLDTKNLSRAIEAAGTVGVTLIPWGVPALFAAGVLSVSPLEFIPFLFFAMIVPVINVIYGYIDFSIAKKEYPETIKTIKQNDANQSIST
jgi:NhaC family Na+:H+ antiporter